MDYPANFIKDNLQIQTNLISSSYEYKVKKLVLFGSSCIYPKDLKKPIKENQMLTGTLEKTNESYSVAKIAGIQMIRAFNQQYKTRYICLMPCNLFGPNDSYDLQNSHFLPALIKKIFNASRKKNKVVKLWGTGKPLREVLYVDEVADASHFLPALIKKIFKASQKKKKKIVKLWGTGKPLREVLYVDEVAEACEYFLKKRTTSSLINIGSSIEMSIKDYAIKIKNKIDPAVLIKFDNNKKLDGVKRKKLNISLATRYGWKAKIDFSKALDKTIEDFKNSQR